MAETSTASIQPRSVDAGRGISWWSDAWALFMRNPGMWIVMVLIALVILIVLSFVPFLGLIATSLLTPVFMGSWMLATRKLEAGGTLAVGDLFTGFQEKQTPLLVLGALLLVGSMLTFFVVGALGIGAAMGVMAGDARSSTAAVLAAIGAGVLGLLAGLLMGVLLAMAFWFAPALVVFQNVAPVDALRASFSANLKNLVAFLLYSVIYVVAAIVASIPFGLGWLVLVPLSLITIYVSYTDVFGQ